MIGVFDSGLGGLTVLGALARRFPDVSFVYLGDHARVPYGDRASEEIVDLTQAGTEALFRQGCRLVVLGCNTATAVAARRLQQEWLPGTSWKAEGRNVLGIVAPTVEAATQTPWAVTSPQYPQKFLTDRIAVFGTTRTIASGVYAEEIRKRCPKVTVIQQVSAELAGAIEDGASEADLDTLVKRAIDGVLAQSDGEPPHRAILGCTHFPLVEHLFRRHLPPATRILSQPEIVADSLEDYLSRHPHYTEAAEPLPAPALFTTGEPDAITRRARIFSQEPLAFSRIEI
ncbi:aspartate/glutamate racemase family protein [Hyphomicrobium sp.]|uniref:glutamate racemase n=1 Tax=Hyphomicrobium sp. TaxID=82 RepID=UPI002B81EE68|nr:aspartate/glutamate racemase family protein [Hyphomicrobium sp.]HRN89989.1 aspartate/glutamate racemase family protein [Hyphomicrobium sp.]HRQ28287.1 aspartate/glutamate racemase family protein [Hyphomicrobium sp.]